MEFIVKKLWAPEIATLTFPYWQLVTIHSIAKINIGCFSFEGSDF